MSPQHWRYYRANRNSIQTHTKKQEISERFTAISSNNISEPYIYALTGSDTAKRSIRDLVGFDCVSFFVCNWTLPYSMCQQSVMHLGGFDAILWPLNYSHCIHLTQPFCVFVCAWQVNYVQCSLLFV